LDLLWLTIFLHVNYLFCAVNFEVERTTIRP